MEPKNSYLKELKKETDNGVYSTYIKLKEIYANQPSFFLDVSDFMLEKGDHQLALRVLSNIAEMKLENHELLRILAHRLKQLKEYELAIAMYKEVKKIREEEPQSYRDLGLAYALNNQPQEAIDELNYVITHQWDARFRDIESLVAYEMNTIIAQSKTELNTSAINPKLLAEMPVDLRIILNWDANNCDMDLWVTDPNGEKCFYSHKETVTGGRMSQDFTGGYGPEDSS